MPSLKSTIRGMLPAIQFVYIVQRAIFPVDGFPLLPYVLVA